MSSSQKAATTAATATQTATNRVTGHLNVWLMLAGVLVIVICATAYLLGSQRASGSAGVFGWLPALTTAGALIALISVWLGVRQVRAAVEASRLAVEAQRRENDRNQAAILRLLD